MSNSTLKTLLKDYEQKRMNAILDLDNRKTDLYASNKRLEEIEMELNSFALNTAKSILFANNETNSVNNLKEKIDNLKKEKEMILNNLNIGKDFFKPRFECDLCEDTGYVRNGYNFNLCSCIKQKLFDIEYNKSNISNLKNDTFTNFNIDLYADKINEELYSSNISPRDNIKNIKNIALNFIDNFEDDSEKNLLFLGNTGLGKTFLSNCIANELLQKGKTVLYQTAPVMLDTIIDYRFNKNNSSSIYENILDVDLLIIDDLGTECMNSMKFSELFNVINTRLLNQNNHITKTIISTNLNLKELSEKYDERIFSRFVGYYNICRFFGEDIRFKK
ncbi:MAG: ATP-binding protein [Clostridia bacterium]|nr:ATP-binding protein [Clostridia bacterium]